MSQAGESILADGAWTYEFRSGLLHAPESNLKRYIDSRRLAFSKLAKAWNDELNTEWFSRTYSASRLIMLATLKLNSARFATEHNLNVVVPYLCYYGVLNSLRALLLVLPSQAWKNGELFKASHSKTITATCDDVGRVLEAWKKTKDKSGTQRSAVGKTKALRELASYKAPTSGVSFPLAWEDLVDMCGVVVELAQLNAEILGKALAKHAHSKYQPGFVESKLLPLIEHDIDGHYYFDDEDYFRVAYYARKKTLATSMYQLLKEGHVDDFFGAWGEKEDEHSFDPDQDIRLIFNLP